MYKELFLGALFLLLFSCPFTSRGGEEAGPGPAGWEEGGEFGQEESQGGPVPTSPASMLAYCSGIKTTRWRQMCEAVFSMDPSKCVVQRQYAQKESCEAMIVAVKKQPSLCDSINKYVTGIDHNGNVVNTTFETDCYAHYAVATLDKSFCSRASNRADCEYRIRLDRNEVPLEQCAGDYTCLIRYAWNNKDKRACERIGPGYGGRDPTAECLAMVTGNASYCDGISSLDSKAYCIGMSKLGRAMPEEGVFMPEKCEGFSDCERELLFHMEKWSARR